MKERLPTQPYPSSLTSRLHKKFSYYFNHSYLEQDIFIFSENKNYKRKVSREIYVDEDNSNLVHAKILI